MVIREVRLHNFKSFAEGSDGPATLLFEPGVNRVAGRNGAGKSSLIEAIGLALFRAEPPCGERMPLDEYVVRTGSRAARVEIVVEADGERYLVDRHFGSSRKKNRVIREDDGFTEAEGEHEVRAFLCRLAGVEHHEQLAEVFTKLIGIRQGRLTMPFDTRASDAKRYFDPLLDVAIYRRCFDALRPVHGVIRDQRESGIAALARVEGELAQLSQCPEAHARAEKELASAQQGLGAIQREHDQVGSLVAQHRERQTTVLQHRQARDAAEAQLRECRERFNAARAETERAERAQNELNTHAAGYRAHVQADANLRTLVTQRNERDVLREQWRERDGSAKQLGHEAMLLREQAQGLATQITEKKNAHRERTAELDKAAADHRAITEAATIRQAEYHRYQAGQSELQRWLPDMEARVAAVRHGLERIQSIGKELAGWDERALQGAAEQQKRCREAVDSVRQTRAGQARERETWQQQLEQIKGGMCPLLREQCRQFDEAKVADDLQALDRQLADLDKQLLAANTALAEASKTHEQLAQRSQTVVGLQRDLEHEDRTTSAAWERLASDQELGSFNALAKELLNVDELVVPQPVKLTVPTTELATIDGLLATFVETARSTWEPLLATLGSRTAAAEAANAASASEASRIEAERKHLAQNAAEVSQLESRLTQLETQVKEKERVAAAAREGAEALAVKGAKYAGLDDQMASQQHEKDQHTTAYESYLAAKTMADQVDALKQALEAARTPFTEAQKALQQRELILKRAVEEFDEEAMRRADARLAELTMSLGKHKEIVAQAEINRQELAERMAVYERLQGDAERERQACRRRDAALAVLDKARRTLQQTAPMVAAQLTGRISRRAQAVFNRINHEPAVIHWSADSYSLRVTTSGGERRFAMLSGGEQTKLSMAMILAMVQEFSSTGLCIFDEPTYGVDAESREMLADAILQVESGFEQLLLVSHDNAFDGRIEHQVTLVRGRDRSDASVVE